jgi:GTPase SAR1 family protein
MQGVREISIMALGAPGVGKSTVGNSLLDGNPTSNRFKAG